MNLSMAGRSATRSSGAPAAGKSTATKRAKLKGRRTPLFVGLLAVLVTLNLIGLVMVLSASSVTSQNEFGTPWHYLRRQAIWSALGASVLLVTQRIDYHRWRRAAGLALGVCVFMLVLVLIPGLGLGANGATRWIGWGPVGVQPSELVKLALLLFTADLLDRRRRLMHKPEATMHPVLTVSGLVAVLIMLQPNLGTTIVVAAIVLTQLFVAGAPLGRLAGMSAVAAGAATFLAIGASYRRARLLAFLNPWKDPLNTGYQTIQAWAAISEGGLSGVGVGAGRAKWGFLPFAHTDFIFAVIAEEFGLVGASMTLLLIVVLGVLGVRTSLRAPDRFGTLLAAGVTTWFMVQSFVNIGAVVGVLPITGVPLPFVSAGGSSLLASMAGAGLLLNVARQSR